MPRKLKNIELNRLSQEAFKNAQKSQVVLVLNDIRSMSNVGSLFRTADAFRVEKICLCGITGKPPHKEIRKTALGAEETVTWEGYENILSCISSYKQKGYLILALEQTTSSIDIRTLSIDGKAFVLVLGNEVDGVSDEVLAVCDHILEIPQYGTKHSFNVAVSGGIALWELLSRQLP
ncbi:MAG: RNA methyltransferase [Bacteroidia bacterium]